MIYAFSNSILYICFAIIIGASILSAIPKDHKPELQLPKTLIKGSTLLVPIVSLVPVLELASGINGYRDESFMSSLMYVWLHLETGKAWLVLALLSLLFIVLLRLKVRQSVIFGAGLMIALGMIVTQGVVGHSANMGSFPGAAAHIFHLVSVSSWAGVLLIVSWFSVSDRKWKEFIDWFTFLALGCIVILTFTGLFMTFLLNERIVDSWILTYGQALLLKHLLYVPLLLFACINGFLISQKMHHNHSFSPRSWWRAESVILISIFMITGFLTEKEPAHNISQTLRGEDPSILFRTFTSISAGAETGLVIQPSVISLLFITIGGVFLFLVFYAFQQNSSPAAALSIAGLAIISVYFGLMSALSIGKEATPAVWNYEALDILTKIVA
ncbi:CopD family protein [Halobacillus sp. A1]|uniref:copper resistance D family protein n=1 Tax=Halobacillus sp. A1 TaxID=2880262 RepID=UPI0020A66CC8|nr:CopD family protein [Halobacillus sp. A1]MCP3031407.1 CopD family protein [Halobacillus sp. A1]